MPEKPSRKSNCKANPICTLNVKFKNKTRARLIVDFDIFHEGQIHDIEFIKDTLTTLIKDHKIDMMARTLRKNKNIMRIVPSKIDVGVVGEVVLDA